MKIKNKLKKGLVCFLATALVLPGVIPSVNVNAAEIVENLLPNQGMENGTVDGWSTFSSDNASTIVLSAEGEPVKEGIYSAKFNRTGTGSMAYQSASNIEIGKEYKFSLWAYSTDAVWGNMILSPWAKNANGNYMWNDMYTEGVLIQANTWTELAGKVKVDKDEEGKLWIYYNDNKLQVINHADASDSQIVDILEKLDIKFTAEDRITTFYLDEFTVSEVKSDNPSEGGSSEGGSSEGGSSEGGSSEGGSSEGETETFDGTFENGKVTGCYSGNGAGTIEITTERVHTGQYAAKFSGRSAGLGTFAQKYTDVELGKIYKYTTWVYSLVPVWANANVTVNAKATEGSELVGKAGGPGVLLAENTWTEVAVTCKVYEENNGVYVQINDSEPVQLANVDASSTDTVFEKLESVVFDIGATGEADILYFDDISLLENNAENPGTTPDGNPGTTPGGNPGTTPGGNPGTIPGENPGTTPGENPGTTPGGNPGTTPGTSTGEDSKNEFGVNLMTNPGFETGTFEGYETQGDNIKVSVGKENVHSGTYALKVTNRKSADEMPFQSIKGSTIRLDEWYEFSVWVNPSTTVWVSLIASPWATGNETGAMMWNDSYGCQKVANAGEWTELKCSYKFTVEDGKLYVTNGTEKLLVQNHAGTGDVTLKTLEKIDFKVNAEPNADVVYVDDFSVVCGEKTTPVDNKSPYNVNLLVNEGFESGTFEGWATQGDNIKISVEKGNAHSGQYSLKVTNRKSADEMPYQSLAGDTIRLNEWYKFTAWIKTSETVWVSLIATPWAVGSETGGMMWNDSYGSQKVATAGEWTKLECAYRFFVEDGKLYIDNGTEKLLVQNHAGTGDVTFASLQQIDFKINAEPNAEVLYVDDLSVICTGTNIPKTGDTSNIGLACFGMALGLAGIAWVTVARRKEW